jgi:hypothetical protein
LKIAISPRATRLPIFDLPLTPNQRTGKNIPG